MAQIHAVLMAVLPQRESMTLDPGDLSCEGDMGMAPGEGGLELRLLNKCHSLIEKVDERRIYSSHPSCQWRPEGNFP